MSRIGRSIAAEIRLVIAGVAEGVWWGTAKKEVSSWSDEHVPNLLVVMVSQLCKHTVNQGIARFKRVNYMACEL